MKTLKALENKIVAVVVARVAKRMRAELLGGETPKPTVRAERAKAAPVVKPAQRKVRAPNVVVHPETLESVKAACSTAAGVDAIRMQVPENVSPQELAKAIKKLVASGLLVKSGQARNTVYALANGVA